MTNFNVHNQDTAPKASQPLLERSAKLYGGMIPNLHGVMAEAPAPLEAYQSLNDIFERTALTVPERNTVWLVVNFENGCTYCMAAHSTVARFAGLPEEDIEALRNHSPLADAKHEVLRSFTAKWCGNVAALMSKYSMNYLQPVIRKPQHWKSCWPSA